MTDKINCFGEANVFDFMDDNQKEIFKKNKGDMGDTNVTKACQDALDSEATTVIFPQGTYLVDGLVVGRNLPNHNNINKQIHITGKGVVKILLSDIGESLFLVLDDKHFVTIENLILESSQQDAKYRYGILFQGNNSSTTIRNISCYNFRGAGIEYRLTVNTQIENYICVNCFYGLCFQQYRTPEGALVGCTTVSVNRAFFDKCIRAITQINAFAMDYRNVTAERCGSKTSNDGAYHFEGGTCQLYNLYGEANNRNFVLVNVKASTLGTKYIVDDPNNPPAPNIIVNSTGV